MLDSPDLPQLSEEQPAPTLDNCGELPEAGEVEAGEAIEVGGDLESGEKVETPAQRQLAIGQLHTMDVCRAEPFSKR